MAFASLVLQARMDYPLAPTSSYHTLLEIRESCIDLGHERFNLNIDGDFSPENSSLRVQIDRSIEKIFSPYIPFTNPPTKLVSTAVLLRGYLSALSASLFVPGITYSLENSGDNDDRSRNGISVQLIYFLLNRLDELISIILFAFSRDAGRANEAHGRDFATTIAIAYIGMVGMSQQLADTSLKLCLVG